MRLKSLFLLLGFILCVISLVDCSRESSIKENVNLRNNHSVVFINRAPFENAEAFADSIINLPNPDSVIVSDTVTVTIGDTIHMMGFLRYNSDRIYLYQWMLDSLVKDSTGKSKMKKVLVTGHNATPQSWVYHKEGVYSPLFVAVDGNSATDTAGKDQFIRVINTPPYLGVPKDTLWTRAKSPITFPVLALDSFGTIKSFKVDLDGKGKREAKEWKYEKSELSDSLYITIPYDSTLTDSLGNQKIYILVTDDDKNVTKDSVNIHFNQLPTIKILGPDDQQRISDTVESFRLFWEGHDKDNEPQLRYYVRVAATPDNQESDLNLSNVYDLVLKNSTASSFVVIENGENALKKLGFTGRYFSWDVWVTDGYDTVVAEKIKTKKGKRPRYFYLGPSKSTCDFIGTAKFEGLSNHSGIKITLINTADTANIYTASTNAKGEFRVSELPAGVFKLIAEDETGRGFVKVSTRTPNINAGDEKELPAILLKDPSPPRIYNIKGIEDTLSARAFTVSGRFSDYGSQVKTAVGVIDKDTCSAKSQYCTFTNVTAYAWSVDLKKMADGKHTFKLRATDSAGYYRDTTISFYVYATNMAITVNGTNSAMVKSEDGELIFKASVEQANPPVTKVTWKTSVPGKSSIGPTNVSNGSAQIKLTKADFPKAESNTRYTMQATADNGAVSNIVRFGFYSDGPMVTIEQPAYDTTITLNDVITLSTEVIASNSRTIEWTCIEGSTKTDNCFAADNLAPTKSWSTDGVKKIAIKVTDNGKTASDTLRVNVIKDPPTITADENDGVLTKKVNSKYKFEYTAKDKYGKVTKVGWRCGDKNGAFTLTTIATPKNLIEGEMTIQLPNSEKNNYKCYIQAIDDDNQVGYDSLVFKVIKDIPTIRLDIQRDTVTIKDEKQLKYAKGNQLGGEILVDYACDALLKNLNVSTWNSRQISGYPIVTMPDNAGKYYCVVRAADAEEPSLYSLDTATYVVLRAPPTVTLPSSYTLSIKDTMTLYANARDSAETRLPGRIVSYEWGCASSGSTIQLVSTGKNTYKVTMPNKADNNYLCKVQVTDDDGLTASATTRFTVVLDMPTVKVARDTSIVRPNFNIVLDATASDGRGYIAKREWSCGSNTSDIAAHWKTVSSFDTTWMAPSGVANYFCVARATDDDGNIATDTMYLKYDTQMPAITVLEEHINVSKGQAFPLDAEINNVWQGINWYSWQCFYKNGTAAETLKKLTYNNSFYTVRKDLTNSGDSLYCVVSAQEKATGYVFQDTTFVRILTSANRPVGKITAADTIYPWSGDDALSGEAVYFYSSEWGGRQSKIGSPLGDANNKDFYWSFSNAGSGFYQGNHDGSLSMNTTDYFNNAFRRPTDEGTIQVCLDFRDSISSSADYNFMLRHQAETVCRTVYVRRAWKNLASDTVLVKSTVRTPPAIAAAGRNLAVAYMTSDNTVASQYYDNASWKTLGTSVISASSADSVTALRMAYGGNVLYLAVLTKSGNLDVYKSNAGTSAWAKLSNNSSITGVASVNLTVRPGTSTPLIAYAKDKKPYFSYWNNNSWVTATVYKSDDNLNHSAREVNAVYSEDGSSLFVTYTDTTSSYTTYYALFNSNSSYSNKSRGKISKEMASVSLAVTKGTLYMGYINRSSDADRMGVYVKKGAFPTGTLSWDSESLLKDGVPPPNIRVAAFNGKVYAAIDDNGRGFSHCHAYILDNNEWKPYGENQLPYFKGTFEQRNGYNLYASAPNIAVNDSGWVYISMIAWASAGSASQNNGPIFMKNISDGWTINTKP